MRLSAAVVLACLLVGEVPARAREHHQHRSADPHKRLEKANALAGEGNCAAAVPEYTAAYEKLQDPIVLFNRADCYRRLGENAKAAEDYRGYLKGFPAAPNRAEIETRIANLEKAARPAAPRTPPAPAPVVRAPTSAAPPPVTRAPPPPVTRAPAVPPPPPPVAAAPMPFLPPPPGTEEPKTLVEAPRSGSSEAPAAEASGSSHWWIWTTLAVVAVGGGVAAYLYLRPKDEPLPATTLGHYRF